MTRTLCLLVLATLALADTGCTCFKRCFGLDKRCDTPPPCYNAPPPGYTAPAGPVVQYGPPPCPTPR